MNAVKQQGISSIGLLIVIGIAAFVLLCGFRIGPLYIDDSFVGSSLQKMAEGDLNSLSNREIRSKISKHFTVDNVRDISPKQIKINRKSEKVTLTLDYEKRIEFLGNLDVVVRFSHKVGDEGSKK